MALDFSSIDREQFRERGISEAQVRSQLDRFKQGAPLVRLQAPCAVNKGIRVFSDAQVTDLGSRFEQAQREGRVMKFVPASGAASRMFHILHQFLESRVSERETQSALGDFFKNLDRFAFSGALWQFCGRKGIDHKILETLEGKKTLVKHLLSPEGMGYETLPKGLIPFHRYPDHIRTAFEEHVVEAREYARNDRDVGRVHFTVSEEHLARVKEFLRIHVHRYELSGTKLNISFSVQKTSTDTLAVDPENKPFRLEGDTLLFRPAGHGALLENLNECGGDIVFIKNIDNVVHDRWKSKTLRFKKALGGLLLQIQTQIFSYLSELEAGSLGPQRLEEISSFIQKELGIDIGWDLSANSLYEILHRPLRVCGMVRNQAEPGGAPFWVQGEGGKSSLQIVESAQVDMQDAKQANIFKSATHFNPVDLVCGLKDHHGNSFPLPDYRDDTAVFISEKTHGGRPLKALELPGLWNGSMAHWNTIFVEVPSETFAPVKTVNDLLKPAHQP